MNHRKKLTVLLCFSISIFLFGLVNLYPEKVGLCTYEDMGCVYSKVFSYGQPVTFSSLFLVLTLIIFFFLPESFFRAWKMSGIFLIPIFILLIFSTPVSCGSLICFNRELVSWISGITFLLISLGIILYKTFQNRFGKKTTL